MMELLPKLYKYKHISFDLWLTLIRSNPEFKPKRDILFKDFFSIDKPIDEVTAIIRKYDVLTNSINEKVCRNFDTFEIYYLILDAAGADINKYGHKELEEYYSLSEQLLMQYKPLLLDKDIPELLKRLQENAKTMNILSNTAFIKGSSLRKITAHYELDSYFSFQAYSDETGYSKPGTEMYQYAYDQIKNIDNIEKHEVLHIGDNALSDHKGAMKFGFDSHLITHNTNEFKLQPA
jgi:putative hydrolase of the HAD superfamily